MPYGDEPIKQLSAEECWALLTANALGRLALSAGGQIDIFPINYHADGTSLLFRTAPGTKLAELTANNEVAVEIDHYTPVDAWSVVVKGTARELQTQTEIAEADKAPLEPWAPTLKYRFVRITPREVTGRYFERAEEPERF